MFDKIQMILIMKTSISNNHILRLNNYPLRSVITQKLKNHLCNVHDHIGAKLSSRLRLRFTHLNKHKFRLGFNDMVNPLCLFGADVETIEHFLLRFHCFSTQRSELSDNLCRHDPSFSKLPKKNVAYLLYGSTNNSSSLNKYVIKLVIRFLKSTSRFNKPLIFDQQNVKTPTIVTTEAAI